jgi:MFS transporter, SIT family, siderophore-iron:H+ symporter
MMMLLVQLIIADISSTRSRVFFSHIPVFPFIINAWVSGNLAYDVLNLTTWRWGYGMWCIIYPVCALPLVLTSWKISHQAKKKDRLSSRWLPFQILGDERPLLGLFWHLDILGVILLMAAFAMVLVPLTLANGRWQSPQIIMPLGIGVCCIGVFIGWELWTPQPLVPLKLMKDRGVWAATGIAVMLNFAWAMQGHFLYTMLVVIYGFSGPAASIINSLYAFTSVVVGPILGLVVFKVRRLKIFIILGTALFMVAFGLLLHSCNGTDRSGVIAAQVVLGIASGMFPYPAQASLQVQLKHENLAGMTGVYMAMYNVGSALGNAVSGAIWTSMLPMHLNHADLDANIASSVYADPLKAVPKLTSSRQRDAVMDAFRAVQRLLTITGICLCIPLLGFALALRDPKLNDEQVLVRGMDGRAGLQRDYQDSDLEVKDALPKESLAEGVIVPMKSNVSVIIKFLARLIK